MKQMAENNDQQQQEMTSMSIMKHKKRNFSHIPIPSNGLILKQASGDYITMSAVRNRRTLSEQISLRDR